MALPEPTSSSAALPSRHLDDVPTGHFAVRGRGLWLARQLCDLVELRSDPVGTTVRLYLTLP
jgi:hypothetical protein